MVSHQLSNKITLQEEYSEDNSLEKLIKGFWKNGYKIDIIYDVKSTSEVKMLIIKASMQGGVTIYMSILPDLTGKLGCSIIKVGDGSVIERFMHTRIPPINHEDIVCPHFLELKWAYGCPFNCSYCYLQGTLRLLPTNKKPMIKEERKVKRHLLAFLKAPLEKPEILNTGELCDSLMYVKTKLSITKNIVPFFEDKNLNSKGHKILIVTKSDEVEELLRFHEIQHVIVSFSINTPKISKKWEKGAASSLSRVRAAKSLFEAGFEVRIRIDPIIPYPRTSWIEHYFSLIDKIFDLLWPSRITLGSLRGLSTTIRKTNDKSWLKYLEEPSRWGYRPSYKIRYKAYRTLIDYINREYGFAEIALCKEPVRMWQNLEIDWKICRCNCVW